MQLSEFGTVWAFKIVALITIFFGSLGIIFFIGSILKYIYLCIKKEDREKIMPPMMPELRRAIQNKDGTFSIVFRTLLLFSFWIALAFWIEYLIKSTS